jgi:hypothetical protein
MSVVGSHARRIPAIGGADRHRYPMKDNEKLLTLDSFENGFQVIL